MMPFLRRVTRCACAAIVVCGALASAAPQPQPPPAQPSLPQRGALPPPPGGRGGGRGRGAVQVMTLSSTAWPDGGQIPAQHTQAGGEISPPLTWSNVPDGVASFVLVAHDVDAATGNGTDDVLHWLVWNVPATATGLAEHVPAAPQLPDG